jgi:hypothetical protein
VIQEIVSVEDQIKSVVQLYAIEYDDAVNESVGRGGDGHTVTVTDPVTVPPLPVHEIIYDVSCIRIGVIYVPPVPVSHQDFVHVVALVEDQEIIDIPLYATVDGFARISTVGRGMVPDPVVPDPVVPDPVLPVPDPVLPVPDPVLPVPDPVVPDPVLPVPDHPPPLLPDPVVPPLPVVPVPVIHHEPVLPVPLVPLQVVQLVGLFALQFTLVPPLLPLQLQV